MTEREKRNMNRDWEKFEVIMQREIKKDEESMSELKEDIFALLRANIFQQRSMLTHIALVAGALASFSLLTLGSSWVYGKNFLIIAIIILLSVIGWSFFSLNSILDYEGSSLSRLLNEYSDFISKLIDSREKVLMDKDTSKYLKSLEELHKNFSSNFKKFEEEGKKKFELKWNINKGILIYAFLFALFLIALSFIKL